MSKPLFAVLGLALASAGFVFFEPSLSSAKTAEPFQLYSSRGRLMSLDEHQGKVVVLDFFASWCPPCARAIPEIERLHEEYRSRGVVVLGVNVNETADPLEFANRMGIQYPVLVNGERVAEKYKVTSIPTFIVISPAGEVVHRASGWNAQVRDKLYEIVEAQLETTGN